MNSYLQSITAGIATYLAALMALVGTYGGHVVQFLGFVLLMSRLVVEVPKAVEAVRSWYSNKKESRNGGN